MSGGVEATLAALSDGTRKAVVDLLSRQPRRAGELAAELSMSPAAMSRHLRVLRRSGIIGEDGIEEDARVRLYHLRREPFDELRRWVEEVELYWGAELASFKQHVESRNRSRGQ